MKDASSIQWLNKGVILSGVPQARSRRTCFCIDWQMLLIEVGWDFKIEI